MLNQITPEMGSTQVSKQQTPQGPILGPAPTAMSNVPSPGLPPNQPGSQQPENYALHDIISNLPSINHKIMTGAPLEAHSNLLKNILGDANQAEIVNTLNALNPHPDVNYGAQALMNSVMASHGDTFNDTEAYRPINLQMSKIMNHEKTTPEMLEKNGDEGANPVSMRPVDPKLLSSLSGGDPMASGPDVSTAISKFIQPVIDSKKLQYQFGGKSLDGKGIDCSGWVAKSTLESMKQLGGYDMSKMTKLMNTDAAHQITSIGKVAGYLPTSAVQDGQLPDGSLIGIATGSKFAEARPLKISHVAQFYKTEDGEPMITMSSKNSTANGPQTLSYTDFLKRYAGKPLYAVNPFALTSK